ncbi:MAG: hypothetical protein EB036_00615 [Betaproteobacteria bacterium]|nr:hypothetical protein [Betaproteobacteria bacterium]
MPWGRILDGSGFRGGCLVWKECRGRFVIRQGRASQHAQQQEFQMNILVNPETSMTPVERAEALLNDPKAGEVRPDERKSEARLAADSKLAAASGSSDTKTQTSAGAASYVQAGAFKVLSDAEALKARLALLGLESRVVKSDAGGAMMYRVRMGPFNRSEDVNRARNRLIEAGVDPVVVKQP